MVDPKRLTEGYIEAALANGIEEETIIFFIVTGVRNSSCDHDRNYYESLFFNALEIFDVSDLLSKFSEDDFKENKEVRNLIVVNRICRE